MRLDKSTTRTILLSFLCVFLADAIITTAFDSYLAHNKYHGDLIPEFIPIIIACAIAVSVGIALFVRFRKKISAAPLSKSGVVVSVILLLVCISSCISELYFSTVLIFQGVISEHWLNASIPSLVYYPLVNFFSNIAESFVKFICGGEMPGGILGSFPMYVHNGTRDMILIVCSFVAVYCVHRLRKSLFMRAERSNAHP